MTGKQYEKHIQNLIPREVGIEEKKWQGAPLRTDYHRRRKSEVQPQKRGNRKNLGPEVRQSNSTDKRGTSAQPLSRQHQGANDMHYHSLSEANEVVTASMMRGAFLGTNIKSNTLLTVFEEFNDRQEKLIGIDLAQSTFNKYDLTYRRLKEFLKVKMQKNDILLYQLDRNFVIDFETYLKTEYKLDTNSSEKLMRIFKRITTMCFKNGQMSKDLFCDHKLKKVKKDRGYLTKAELESIIDYKPDNKRLEKVRDIFLFCCFTGYDYSTTTALTDKDLVADDDGALWIDTHRIKTKTAAKVKLLDIPLSIIKKYERKRDSIFLLPVMSNAKYNLYLKEIAAACEIEKNVTSHLARHTNDLTELRVL